MIQALADPAKRKRAAEVVVWGTPAPRRPVMLNRAQIERRVEELLTRLARAQEKEETCGRKSLTPTP